MTWAKQAACLGHDPELWFSDEGSEQTGQAITICEGCPVRFECLEDAIKSGEHEGVWGGYTQRQRARVARGQLPGRRPVDRPRLAPCGTKSARARHRRYGESCSACTDMLEKRRVAACGTRSGFGRHKAEGTPPCDGCVEVERTYQRERKREQARLRRQEGRAA